MPAILWLICVPILTLCCRLYLRPEGRWREAFVQALLGMAVLSWLSTLALSVLHQLSFGPLLVCWLAVAVAGLLLIRQRRAELSLSAAFWPSLPWSVRWQLVVVAIMGVLPLLYLTLKAAPNNYDGMTYHMSRVMHWMQNGHVFHYPTAIARQLYHNPLAEYLILQPQLLGEHDYFANAIQFGAMLGSLAVISLLARQFGLDAKGQMLAVLLAFSVPMGILQSTSVQNDYVAGFFLLSSLLYGLRLCNPPRNPESLSGSGEARIIPPAADPEKHSGLLGLSLALGALTKYTVLIYALPFCLWWGLVWLRRKGVWTTLRRALFIAVLLGIFLAPFWYMNRQTFGNILGPAPGSSLDLPMANRPVSPGHTVSNLIRNVGVHQALPLPFWNQFVDGTVYGLHEALGLDTNDLNGTYLDTTYGTQFGYTEDNAGNFLHFWLLTLAIGLWVYRRVSHRMKPSDHPVGIYAFCLTVAFVLFSALMRWQPMHPRLELPLTLASCVPVVWAFSRSRLIAWRAGLGWALIIQSLPYILFNKSKPFLVPERLVRQITQTPNAHIPPARFSELLRRVPAAESLLRRNYDPPGTISPDYELRKNVSASDRQRLLALFDSLNFMKRQSVLFTSRQDDYFQNRRNLQESFEGLTSMLAAQGCRHIGLDLSYEAMEYPLWILAKEKVGPQATLRYVVYAPEMVRTPEAGRSYAYDCLVTEFDDTQTLFPATAIRYTPDNGPVKAIFFRQPQTRTWVKERFLLPEQFR